MPPTDRKRPEARPGRREPPHDPRAISLTRQQARSIDRLATERYAIPSIILMENAAIGLARACAAIAPPGRPILILCGPGNNGGDGLALARHLHNAQGTDPRVALAAPPDAYKGDAATNLEIIRRMGLDPIPMADDPDGAWKRLLPRQPQSPADPAAEPAPDVGSGGGGERGNGGGSGGSGGDGGDGGGLIVDALLGTGLDRPVSGRIADLIQKINHLKTRGWRTLSVDIPSGLDADTGEPLGDAVRADLTVTFIAPKAGFSALAAQEYLGAVRVADIGIPPELARSVGTLVQPARRAHEPRSQPPDPPPGRPGR